MDKFSKYCFKDLESALTARFNEKTAPDDVKDYDFNGLIINKKVFKYLISTALLYNKGNAEVIHWNIEDTDDSINDYCEGKEYGSFFGLLFNDGRVKLTYIPECDGDHNLSNQNTKQWISYASKVKAKALVYFSPFVNELLTDSELLEGILEVSYDASKEDVGFIILPTPATDDDRFVLSIKSDGEKTNVFQFDVSNNNSVMISYDNSLLF